MRLAVQISALLLISLGGCSIDVPVEPGLPKPSPSKREMKQAEGLLRLLYLPERSNYALRYSPERDDLNQTTSELRDRVKKIRDAKGNVSFKIETCDKHGETIAEIRGIFDREENSFRYNVSEQEREEQPTWVWVEFLDWHEDSSVISFTEVASDPFTAEHFEISHGSRLFHMTLSGRYLIH